MYPEKAKKALKYALDTKEQNKKGREALQNELYAKAQELDALKAEMKCATLAPAAIAKLSNDIQETETAVKALSMRWLGAPASMLDADAIKKAVQMYQTAQEEYKAAYAEAVKGFEAAEKEMQKYSCKARTLNNSFAAFSRKFDEVFPGTADQAVVRVNLPENFHVEEYAMKKAKENMFNGQCSANPTTPDEILTAVFRGIK